MMILDTHAWIWLVSDPDQLSDAARNAIGGATDLAISSISCWEFAMLCHKRRISVTVEPRLWMEQSLAAHRVVRLDLTPEIAARAYDLGTDFHGDPADRLIVATSLLHGAQLVTKDDQIRNCSAAPVCIW